METLETSTSWVQIAVQKSSSSGKLSGDYEIYANLGRTCLIAPHLIFPYTKAKSQQSNHKYKYSLDIHIILTYYIYIYILFICFNFLVSKIPALSFRVLENVKETHSILNRQLSLTKIKSSSLWGWSIYMQHTYLVIKSKHLWTSTEQPTTN